MKIFFQHYILDRDNFNRAITGILKSENGCFIKKPVRRAEPIAEHDQHHTFPAYFPLNKAFTLEINNVRYSLPQQGNGGRPVLHGFLSSRFCFLYISYFLVTSFTEYSG
jgi:hypothetical protein